MKARGIFITFEGVDGSGKSSQFRRAARYCRERGLRTCVTREPGGTVLGRRLRSLLLKEDLQITPIVELFLVEADRAQHVNEVLRPALREYDVVLCDRYIDSTLAYQVYAGDVPLSFAVSANGVASGGLRRTARTYLMSRLSTQRSVWANEPKPRQLESITRLDDITNACGRGFLRLQNLIRHDL